MTKTKRIRVAKDLDRPRTASRCREILNGRIAYLSVFMTELLTEQEMHYTDAVRRRHLRECMEELLGGPHEGWGILQREMNAESGGILSRLVYDMPEITLKEQLLFSYVHAGFTNKMMCLLLELPDEATVSLLHSRLRSKIGHLHSPFINEYLDFLPKRACRIGQEMLYLHNL